MICTIAQSAMHRCKCVCTHAWHPPVGDNDLICFNSCILCLIKDAHTRGARKQKHKWCCTAGIAHYLAGPRIGSRGGRERPRTTSKCAQAEGARPGPLIIHTRTLQPRATATLGSPRRPALGSVSGHRAGRQQRRKNGEILCGARPRALVPSPPLYSCAPRLRPRVTPKLWLNNCLQSVMKAATTCV
jgi:hypothetical protein